MMDANHESKSDLRGRISGALMNLSEDELHERSVRACHRLMALEAFSRASVVMMYMPLQREVDVTGVALECFRRDKTVCVPRVNWARRDMTPVEARSFDDRCMEVDVHGLRTPRNGAPVPLDAIDLIVVPGVAFDTSGNRLGRGGGFYDRFLPRLGRGVCAVGVGFDVQVVDAIPMEDQDIAVDILVTDRRVTHARPCGSRQ